MRVQVLGPGCAKCKTLAANAAQAVRELGLDVQIEKVEDVREIARFGVMVTPALALDGKVRVVGKVLTASAIKELLAG